jgi:hypothetical protein
VSGCEKTALKVSAWRYDMFGHDVGLTIVGATADLAERGLFTKWAAQYAARYYPIKAREMMFRVAGSSYAPAALSRDAEREPVRLARMM